MLGSLLRRALFIRTTQTPNPSFLKFMPGKTVMEEGTMDFSAPRFATISPLARNIFNIQGVTRVFYGKDFIAVGKQEEVDWSILKPLVFEAIMEQFSSPKQLFSDEPQPEDTKILETDTETVALIKEILDARVRPFVQEDGGDIKFIKFEEDVGRVLIQMRGSCTGCPSSAVTLKNGVEKLLKYYVPEVQVVESVDLS
mmetsp:Transcript_29343/g.52528  ORF Transcript_29343/g.52528 Transcript_29343/m.52528 type:complete len:198 (+) Transcript_29343:147-740(+)